MAWKELVLSKVGKKYVEDLIQTKQANIKVSLY